MAEETVITEEMRAWLGRETPAVAYEVDKGTVRMFARAVGHTDPVFYDEEFAKSKGYRSLPAPPGYLGTPIYDPRTADDPIGPPRFETRLTRKLNGGTEIEYFDDICAGDLLLATTTMSELYERRGGIGLMLINVRETTFKRDGKVVAKARGTSINY